MKLWHTNDTNWKFWDIYTKTHVIVFLDLFAWTSEISRDCKALFNNLHRREFEREKTISREIESFSSKTHKFSYPRIILYHQYQRKEGQRVILFFFHCKRHLDRLGGRKYVSRNETKVARRNAGAGRGGHDTYALFRSHDLFPRSIIHFRNRGTTPSGINVRQEAQCWIDPRKPARVKTTRSVCCHIMLSDNNQHLN